MVIESFEELGQDLKHSHLVLSLLQIKRQEVQNLSEVVFPIFTGKGNDVFEDNAASRMSPFGPHLDQLLEASLDSFRRIFDISVPDLVGGESSHLQIIILDDVYGHNASVIRIGLIIAPGVVHVALDDVQDLPYQNDGCVSLLPVVFENPIAQGLEQQVCMAQAVVVYQHFLHQHRRVSDVLLFVRYEAVHVFVHFFDEALELLRPDHWHVQKHQNIPFFL